MLFMDRDGIARTWSQFLAEHPLVLTPTWTQLPFEHGFDVATPAGTTATMEMVRPAAGQPARAALGMRSGRSRRSIRIADRRAANGASVPRGFCLDAAETIEARLGLDTPIDPLS